MNDHHDAPPDTDPGGHEPPLSELPPRRLEGAPAWAQELFDEQRGSRNDARSMHRAVLERDAELDQMREALKAHGERIQRLENALLGHKPTPPAGLRAVGGGEQD